ncbi:MAG: DUF3782 domain-containing protein [Synechococcaceae cyanobacterium SM1_2_3]|nr:DUF3782 domain-containing protein [Synechococcaceae cyanobacterium SM1_2_3]
MSTLTPELRDRLRQELPGWLREDSEFSRWILNLARSEFADRQETESRFDRVLDEMRRDREAQERKWAEQIAENHRLHAEVMAMADRLDRKLGALGARWGLLSETAFRDGLAAILEKSFGVEVININDYDDEGLVFGRPDQVELGILIKNGLLIACEIKSSMDKAGLYIFSRKVDFYERKHQRKADRRLVITPFLDPRAAAIPKKLGIEVYADPMQMPVD